MIRIIAVIIGVSFSVPLYAQADIGSSLLNYYLYRQAKKSALNPVPEDVRRRLSGMYRQLASNPAIYTYTLESSDDVPIKITIYPSGGIFVIKNGFPVRIYQMAVDTESPVAFIKLYEKTYDSKTKKTKHDFPAQLLPSKTEFRSGQCKYLRDENMEPTDVCTSRHLLKGSVYRLNDRGTEHYPNLALVEHDTTEGDSPVVKSYEFKFLKGDPSRIQLISGKP